MAFLLILIVQSAPSLDAQRLAALYERRDYRQVAHLIGAQVEFRELLPREQLLLAMSLWRAGRLQDAHAAFRALDGADLSLGNYLPFVRATVAAAVGDCDAATLASEELPRESMFAASGWWSTAVCWLGADKQERLDVAVHQLEQSAKTDNERANALYLRGRAAQTRGALEEAKTHYLQVLGQAPVSAAGRRAQASLQGLTRGNGKATRVDIENLLSQADSEMDKGRRSRARRLYRTVLSKGRQHQATLKAQAELGMVELDMVAQRYGVATRRLQRALGLTNAPTVKARGLYLLGDVLSRRGRARDALDTYRMATQQYPDEPYSAESALAGARLAYNMRDFDLAEQFSHWLVQRGVKDASVMILSGDGARVASLSNRYALDHAHWLLAWMQYQQGGSAQAVLRHLEDIDSAGALAPKALYWRIKLLLEQGDFTAADVLSRRLMKQAPTDFYALAALELIGQVAPSCEVDWQVPAVGASGPPLVQSQDLRAALAFMEYGLQSEAMRVVRMQPSTVFSDADRVVAAWLYRHCGDVHRATQLTRRVVQNAAVHLDDPALFSLSFPRPYAEIVQANAERYNVPEALIYAVMREESGFKPRALSPRHARGLMQMMHYTARRMARSAGLSNFHLGQLFEPTVSIQLGVHYLSLLLEQFDNNVVAVMASYHAGEDRVAKWLHSRQAMSMDEFLEDLPFDTTRGYVKKVLASSGMYRVLYGDPANTTVGLFAAGMIGKP